MTILLQILISVIENITFLGNMFYLTGTLSSKIFRSTRNSILIAVSTILMYYIQLHNNSHLHFSAVFAILQYFIVTKIVSQTPLKNTLTAVVFTYIMQSLFQFLVLYLVLWINPKFNIIHSLPSLLFIMAMTLLLTIIILRFLPVRNLYEKTLKIPNFVILGFSFFFMLIGIFSPFFEGVSVPPYLILFFSTIFVFLVLIFVLYFAFQTQKKEQTIHYYKTYLPILNDMILSIRKTQHNNNNTIQAIAGLAQSYSDYDSLAAALEQYGSQAAKNTIPAQLLHFENKLLTALLYNKYCLALEKQIHLNITIHNYFYISQLNEFQIVELTGILLDNAMEAAHPNDNIFLEIGSPVHENITTSNNSQTPFTITVKNPGPEATQDFTKQIFSAGYTSKTTDTEDHGLGLSYVKTLAHRYKGHIEVSNETITDDESQKECRYFVISVSI